MMKITDVGPTISKEEVNHNGTKEKREYFRGYIQSKTAAYYILNELVSGDNTKVFSAVKIHLKEKEKLLESQKYCIRYISKEWINSEIFEKLQIHEERVKKFYDSLRKKFESYKKISHINIQDLKDFIEDEDGIYIVFEFCDYTLKDYVQLLREPVKSTRYPFEIKVRKMIYQILDLLSYMQDDTVSMSFGGMLNSSDIMITEFADSSSSNSYIVKFPHPFMLELFTFFKIYNIEKFPSFYSPEIYKLFEAKEVDRAIERKDAFDLSSLMNKFNHNMDMWSLGYLIFEIIFEDPPFVFSNLYSATKSLNSNFNYKIFPRRISKKCLELITKCLQLDPQDRIKTDYLTEMKFEFKKENENLEDMENSLKNRMSDKKDFDYVVEFNISSYNDYEKY